VPDPASSDAADGWATAEAIRSGRRTAAEIVDEALQRIVDLDGDINAFTVTFPDQARAAAAAADRQVAAGGQLPPLLGVPVSVKDHIWMAGAPATNGSVALQHFVPPEDCTAVARLRDAGAVIVGKTNNPEFCYRGYTDNNLFGPTRNPWEPHQDARRLQRRGGCRRLGRHDDAGARHRRRRVDPDPRLVQRRCRS
jgi:Asp-tRNA(Asn)/Glu-tRNA(Gln) amidotransferase A subunit family amidase